MTFVIKFGEVILSMIYAIFKLLPVHRGRVLFLSRQSDELSMDFEMLRDALIDNNKDCSIVAICNRLDDNKSGMAGFAVDTLRSMIYLATSEVCVIDSYWPVVSILHHKEQLTVIQMWHALGKIKQSGYQTLGKAAGRSEKTARLLKMHENYDYIIAGGEAWNKFYCLSFNTTEDKLVNIGLPRIDYLINTEQQNRKRIIEAYPEFRQRKVLLYAPTFRRGYDANWEDLLNYIDFNKYVLVVKCHPNQQLDINKPGIMACNEFTSAQMLSVCDYLITDYSAIAVEGAVLNKKTLYYLYDYDVYMSNNGINVSPKESMPGCAFEDAAELMEVINGDTYNQDCLDRYRKCYLPKNLGTSTEQLASLVKRNMNN